jgi:hypothetical protein
VRISRLLAVPLGDLSCLSGLSQEELRAFGDGARAIVAGPGSRTLRRLAALTDLLPTPLLTAIAERFVDPPTAVQVLEYVDIRRVEAYSRGLSVGYLADLASYADPILLAELVPAVAPAQIREVVTELGRRGDGASLAMVAANMSPNAVARFLEVIDEDSTVLMVASLLADDVMIDQVVACLSTTRVARLIEVSSDPGRAATIDQLLDRLSESQRSRVRTIGERHRSASDQQPPIT